jgi:hypothetical protein
VAEEGDRPSAKLMVASLRHKVAEGKQAAVLGVGGS